MCEKKEGRTECERWIKCCLYNHMNYDLQAQSYTSSLQEEIMD